ncbi:O-antigen ligase family protein [Halomarina ordinaria]|uniref:O-antigen ligase family protein n=1 Tax=Halomarina ordinaria TaxID=3033939 RepID=A0ABD5U8L7_9EURY|nr:O-antigen ligase family protein [Halomarina sp. PSRA2]
MRLTPRRSREGAGGRWRTRLERVLLVALAVAYPFHFSYQGPTGGVNVSYGDAVVALVGVLFLLGAVGRFRVFRYAWAVAAFVGVAVVSVLVNGLVPPVAETFSWTPAVAEVLKLLGAVAWMVAIYALCVTDPARRFRDFSLVSVALAVVFGAWSVSMVLAGAVRHTGPFTMPNVYANYLLLNVFLACYLVGYYGVTGRSPRARWPRARRWGATLALWTVVPFLAGAMVATGSRGAAIGLAVGGVALAVTALRWLPEVRPWFAGLNAAVFGAYAVGGVYAFMRYQPRVFDRFVRVLDGDARNLDSRLENWAIAWDAFTANPLLGLGYGQYPAHMAEVVGGGGIGAHNTYLTVAAETGIVGLVVLLVLVGLLAVDGLTLVFRERAFVAVPVFAFVAAAFGQGLVADVNTFRALWIGVGALGAFYYASVDRPLDPLSSVFRRWVAVGDPESVVGRKFRSRVDTSGPSQ